MSNIFVHGVGAVSPAGWGIPALRDSLTNPEAIPAQSLSRPGWERPLQTRAVPAPNPRPAFFGHTRLRRTSPISQYAVAAALEALGSEKSSPRLGVILCVMTGCVNYSRRFYDETLRDPATASPLVFPETVFNAPSSHIAALLGTTAINYTLVGDPGTFLQGLALAADWLLSDRLDRCLVLGAEEIDWLSADAYRLFEKRIVLAAGAGAVLLGCEPSQTTLSGVTESHLFTERQNRACAAIKMRAELGSLKNDELLCDSTLNLRRHDAAESNAWHDWKGARLSPKRILGEGLAAGSAWQCVAAIDALRQRKFSAATVSVVGCNQQAIGARFEKRET